MSRSFPPFVVGSSVLMANLFHDYPGEVEALSGWPYGPKIDGNFKPPCKTHYLKVPTRLLRRINRRYPRLFVGINKWFIRKKIKRIRPDFAFIVYPRADFLVPAYQICREFNIPYFIHMHDLWEENFEEGNLFYRLAKEWEREIFLNATKRFAMTEVQQRHYQEKYGFAIDLLPHTVRGDKLNEGREIYHGKWIAKNIADPVVRKKIVYTGNVSAAMNLDALQQFVKAVGGLAGNIDVKMFVSLNKQQLKDCRIYNENIEYNWLPIEEVQSELRNADVLILPLSFKNCAMDEVRTVYATKALDYLISSTPILVFSPADSFHSISAVRDGWGLVVDQDSPDHIVKGIERLIENPSLAQSLVDSAFDEASSRNSSKYAHYIYDFVKTHQNSKH